MTRLGLDWSTARPSGAQLAAAGVFGAMRYLASDARGLTTSELADLTAHGIHVGLVYEGTATQMLNGYNQGVADAKLALARAQALGVSAGAIYWAADTDIGPSGTVAARVAPATAYVQGWNTVIPAGRRGGYGGLWFLSQMKSAGLIDFLWECASTSFRHGVTQAQCPTHIQQTTIAPPIPSTDHNYIYADNFGQVGGAPAPQPAVDLGDEMKIIEGGTVALVGEFMKPVVYPSMSQGNAFSIGVNGKVFGTVTGLSPDEMTTLINEGNARYQQALSDLAAKLGAGTVNVAIDTDALAAAISSKLVVNGSTSLSDADIQALSESVSADVVTAIKEQWEK